MHDKVLSFPESPATLDGSRLHALGWAAFVAVSWTWCIGMFLPVLLVRDYGVAGWMIFAIPNVVGAAALGWVLQRPRSAASLARQHWPAAVAFSVVTILFHAFFVGWIIRSLVGDVAEIITLSAAAGFYLAGRRGRRDLAAAAGLLGFSLIAFVVAVSLPAAGRMAGLTSTAPAIDLLWLAPVCIFGFLLCPYLDLTFLRARAATVPVAGVAAFTIGFGVMFLAMILFTLWYAPYFQPTRLHFVPSALKWVVAGHMMLQSGYTVAVHSRSVAEHRRATKSPMLIAFAIAVIAAFLVGVWGEGRLPSGKSAGEMVYRLFLAFYGLIFPTYVWLCMIPKGRITTRTLAIFAVALLVAGPMFWLGFIDGRMVWLAPGLAAVLAARVFIRPPRPATVATVQR